MEKVIFKLALAFSLFFVTINLSHGKSASDINEEGAVLAEKGDSQEAFKKFQQAVKADAKLAKAQSNLGQMAMELGQKNTAYEAYSAYILLEPKAEDRVEVIKTLVNLRGELDEKLPAGASSQYDIGRNHVKAKEYDKAEDAFDKGLEFAPWGLEGYFLKASNFAVQGKKEDAHEAMDNYAKYTSNTSDVSSKRSEIDSLLSKHKSVEQAEKTADAKEDKAKSAEKTAGISFMYGLGFIMPNTDAHNDSLSDQTTYKDMLDNPKAMDVNFYHINPDSNFLYRIGYSRETFSSKDKSIPVLVSPDLNLTTVDVNSTNLTIDTLYGGIGLGMEEMYIVFDMGLAFIELEDLTTTVTSGATEIKSIPFSETAIMFGMAFGTHIPLSSLFSLNIEMRYNAPPLSPIYKNSKNSGTKPGVEGAKWFGTLKMYAGFSIRF